MRLRNPNGPSKPASHPEHMRTINRWSGVSTKSPAAIPAESPARQIPQNRQEPRLRRRRRQQPPFAPNKKFVAPVERDGRVLSRVITGADKPIGVEIQDVLYRNAHRSSVLHTDGAQHYKVTEFTREAVDHNKQFARDAADGSRVHTNTAEGYFSIFKRGLVGTYQHMSEQHLPRYLAEFDFRMNHRVRLGYSDDMRADIALKGIAGKRLTYRRPVAA
jgi:hypothetical protein